MNVTLPNGYTIEGVPEGTSKDEIMQKAIAAGYAKPEDFGQAETSPVEQPTEQPQEQGFIGNVVDDFVNRGEELGKNLQIAQEELLSAGLNPVDAYQAVQRIKRRVVGGVTGAAGDVVGQGIASIADTITPEPVQEKFKEAVGSVVNSSPARSVAEIYKGFKDKNPQLAQDVTDVANIGMAVLPFKGVKVPIKPQGSKGIASKVLDKSSQKVLNEAVPDIKQLKEAAGEIYARLDNSSSRVAGNRLDSLGNKTKQKLVAAGYDKDLYPQLKTIITRLDDASGQKLSIGELQNLRKLTDAPLGSLNKSEARLGGIARDSIDDFIESLTTKDFIGKPPKNVGAELQDARQLWRRAKKLEVIDEAMSKAKLQASGFENGIRTQFRSILNNKNKRKGFKKEELDAMQSVVKGGKIENVAKALGKFGFSEGQASNMLLGSLGLAGGFAAGGAGGAALVPVVGQISKTIAQKLTKNNANAVRNIIAAGDDGEALVKAYISATKKSDRSVADLTELLLRPDVNLKALSKNLDNNKTSGSNRSLVADAVYMATIAKSRQDNEDSNNAR